MLNVCRCMFVEDAERSQIIFLDRKVKVIYFNEFEVLESCFGILKDIDDYAVFIEVEVEGFLETKFILLSEIIDIRLSD